MAKYSFIIELEVSSEDKEDTAYHIRCVLANWLNNVHFITKLPEAVIQVKPISRVIHQQKTEENGEDTRTDTSIVASPLTESI